MVPPRFTIVTPSFNSARYVEACLRSVAEQQFSGVEQLVVDAGSTDGTQAIVAKFPHAKLVHEPGSSQSEALNAGFQRAAAPTIGWLNSDDLLLPGALAHVAQVSGALGERWFLYGNFVHIDEATRFVAVRVVQPLVMHALRNFSTYVPTSGSFFSRRVVDDGILLETDLHYLMDREFTLTLHERGYRVVRTHRLLSAFRVHAEQKSYRGANEEARASERARINRRHGGLWLRGHRVLGWNEGLMRLGHLFVASGAKAGRALGTLPIWAPNRAEIDQWLTRTTKPGVDPVSHHAAGAP